MGKMGKRNVKPVQMYVHEKLMVVSKKSNNFEQRTSKMCVCVLHKGRE